MRQYSPLYQHQLYQYIQNRSFNFFSVINVAKLLLIIDFFFIFLGLALLNALPKPDHYFRMIHFDSIFKDDKHFHDFSLSAPWFP